MRLSGMLIDTAAARRMNRAYYEDNIELSFRTEAMYTKYQTAFARYLYDYIAKNFQFRETVNVLELGARGVYFEEGVHAEMQRLDSANGTSVAEKINYTIMDLSRPAIEHARERAELSPLFRTGFIVGDVLADPMPKDTSVFIMNELLDDLDYAVLAKFNGRAYRIDYKLAMSESISEASWPITLKAVRRAMDDGGALMERAMEIPEKRAVPVILDAEKLFGRIRSSAARHDSILLFMHDYGVLSPVPVQNAKGLKRLFFSSLPEGLLNADDAAGKVQITTDVGWPYVFDALSRSGFSISLLDSHPLFLDKSIGAEKLNPMEMARLINMLDDNERAALMRETSSLSYTGISGAGFAPYLNALFGGRFFFRNGSELSGRDISLNTKSLCDKHAATALYGFYAMHSWRLRNSYFDVAATAAITDRNRGSPASLDMYREL